MYIRYYKPSHMKRLLLLIIILIGFGLSSKAQGLIGSPTTTIIDSMKKQDSFNQGVKHVEGGNVLLNYLNFMHKDGTFKINDDFVLVSSQFEMKNDKCIAEYYLYKDALLNKFTTTFNTDTANYKSLSNNEWFDKKDNLSIKITSIPEQKCFLIQYELKKE